ncbi:MAG: SDR family NAD(P)-dependent oxidoreductase [Kiritimatiellae bacterium]|nr:SDR family NAD(P)-dependent oxidoreductase [Kiritimatiellia bacterium]
MNILITGASSGIGEAIAYAYAQRGDRLYLCGRDKTRLDAVAAKCRELGASSVCAEIQDVTQTAQMRDFIERADELSPLDIVFANAGTSTGIENETNIRNTFAANVGGVLNTVLPAVDLMKERHKGQIVITASIAGYGPLPACPSYSATKACVKTWALALRGHLKPYGVRVSAVCPGFVRSRITDKNTCPMPFFMEADKAAKIILKGVAANKAIIAFPWPMRLGAWFMGAVPAAVCEVIGRFLPKKN